MRRNTLLLAVAVLVSMLGFWYIKSQQQLNALPTEAVTVLSPVITPRQKSTPDRETIERTKQRIQSENELANLQTQLVDAAKKLEAQKNTLDQLRQRQQAAAGQASYSSQIHRRDSEIQNLIETLGSYRQAEDDINRAADVAAQNQDSQARLARDQVDTGMQALEQEIRNTQNELNYWQNYPAGLDVTNQKSEIERLQNQLAQQTNDLSVLRTQKVNISAQVLSNFQSTDSLAESARLELRNSAAETQSEILSLRSEIDGMQDLQNQRQGAARIFQSQLSQAEKDFEAQSQGVRALEESIRAKQSELH